MPFCLNHFMAVSKRIIPHLILLEHILIRRHTLQGISSSVTLLNICNITIALNEVTDNKNYSTRNFTVYIALKYVHVVILINK